MAGVLCGLLCLWAVAALYAISCLCELCSPDHGPPCDDPGGCSVSCSIWRWLSLGNNMELASMWWEAGGTEQPSAPYVMRSGGATIPNMYPSLQSGPHGIFRVSTLTLNTRGWYVTANTLFYNSHRQELFILWIYGMSISFKTNVDLEQK